MVNSQPTQAPPNAQQAERALLGAVLINSDALQDARSIVQPSDFYNKSNGALFGMMLRMSDGRREIDSITVAEELAALGRLSDVGGEAGLIAMVNETPSTIYAATYAEQIALAAERRRALRMASALAVLAQRGAEASELIECAQKFIDGTRSGGTRLVTMQDAARQAYDTIGRLQDGENAIGITSGLSDLDRVIRGFFPGRLSVLFAHTGDGKSTLAGQIAVQAAEKGYKVLIFSTEMEADEILLRWAAGRAKVDSDAVYNRGELADEARTKIYNAIAQLQALPITFNTDAVSLAQIRAEVARQQPDMVIVDHIGHLQESARKGEDGGEWTDRMFRELKLCAKHYKTHIMAIAHANKTAIGRLQLKDLSGSKAKDPDIVIGLYRPGLHGDGEKSVVFVDVLKHRGGKTDNLEMVFVGEQSRIGQLQKGLQGHG